MCACETRTASSGGSSSGVSAACTNRFGPSVRRPRLTPMRSKKAGSVRTVVPAKPMSTDACPMYAMLRSAADHADGTGLSGAKAGGHRLLRHAYAMPAAHTAPTSHHFPPGTIPYVLSRQ